MNVADIKTWARRVEKRAVEIMDELEMSDDPCIEALQLEVEAVRLAASEALEACDSAFDGEAVEADDTDLGDW